MKQEDVNRMKRVAEYLFKAEQLLDKEAELLWKRPMELIGERNAYAVVMEMYKDILAERLHAERVAKVFEEEANG